LDYSFKKADRLLKRNEFIQLSKSGRKFFNDYFIVLYAPGRYNRSRLGITVTRKVGKAVKRNRIKRLIREYFRLNRQRLSGIWDINVIAKKEAADLSSDMIFDALCDVFERISNRDGN
jgi:ribonuclease P protein component